MGDIKNRQSAIALLRRFEPILRFTRGENFFPLDVQAYVENCSLWERFPNREAVCLIPKGELNLERLGKVGAGNPNAVRFLRFVEQINIKELATHQLQQLGIGTTSTTVTATEKGMFRAGRGRLARVGYISRFADAVFSFLLFARGRVPWSTAAAAVLEYERVSQRYPNPRYYGRVIRQGNWMVLQYWFFYAFNNWRSGFFGTNDHEADWEMICIYLSDAAIEKEPDSAKPEWIAYAAHDDYGDDLRRHWTDAEVEKEGEHPVIYVGAGSHASYFRSGEYMTEVPVPFFPSFIRAAERIRIWWRKLVSQYDGDETQDEARSLFNFFRIPFVDYARGDGVALGQGQERNWDEPVLIEPAPDWARNYRGLWGLYTGDPFAGEDAPAGVMYTREGSIRSAWYDPVGWSGLEKVAPADKALEITLVQQDKVRERLINLEKDLKAKSEELEGLGVEAAALRLQPDLQRQLEIHNKVIEEITDEVKSLRARFAADEALLESLRHYEQNLRAGFKPSSREHLRHAHAPISQAELNRNRLGEVWAAASIGIMLLGFVALVLFAQQYLINAIITIVFIVLLIESWFRKSFIRFVVNVTVGLALVSALILLYQFFWPSIVALVLAAGVYLLWENLRELWT